MLGVGVACVPRGFGVWYYCFMTDLFVFLHCGLDYCDGV